MTNYLTIITPSYRDSFAVSLNIDPLLYLNIDPANKQRDDELLNHHYTVIPRFIRGIS
ncbi:hypothetical protein [Wolbachia endosymbiont (group A) of Gymnosoma rotundatum]|uniref:hypothetical protein n=1 Tax=Wolbachia endosymbiont (group A) of Gymnosoma rotundatum TaxID=2954016 RepID=UPI000FEF4F8D|nr:hypothetical protein [Wolbachia endosymbiont (group A) of Gymnosoma rotundatum]RLT62388.1 hypothetical protein WANA34_0372 [Wolbachia endosymbiont of Drosophila ananassae]